MSIHVLHDNTPRYCVQPILPCYKGNNKYHRFPMPGGRSANKRRPVNNYRGTDLNSADGGPETGASVPRTSGSLSFPHCNQTLEPRVDITI